MARLVAAALAATMVLGPLTALAQAPPPAAPAPAAGPQEIKLDEPTTLKAAAVEARMSAILANFALLQRQAQDLQQEMAKMLEERKKLIEEAAKKVQVPVADANEWAFDNKNQRYVHVRRAK